MSYAEQNRQVLLRCEPDQILTNTPERVLEALRKGELVALKHYPSSSRLISRLILVPITVLLVPLICALVLLPDSQVQTAVGVAFVSVLFIIPFLLSSIDPWARRRAKQLNKLWAEGRLVTSQRVEVGDARDSDYRYEVKYEFSAPDGERIIGWRNTDHIKTQQPTMLMIYKSPDEYIVL